MQVRVKRICIFVELTGTCRLAKAAAGSGFYHFLPGMFVGVMVRHRMMILDTRARPWSIGSRIGMNINSAISPGAAPGSSADDNSVRTPGKARPCPAIGHERRPDKYAGSKVDGEAHRNPGSRRSVNHRRTIDGNVEEGRIYRLDLDISPRIDHVVVGIRSQITIAISLLTHSPGQRP